MNRIYVTHCSAKKDEALRFSDDLVPPDVLYTATPLRRFADRCREAGVAWAISSDKYGVVFPHERIVWYDKDPATVTYEEFAILVENFARRLSAYDEVWFYHNPGRFHSLYRRLLEKARSQGLKVYLFSHLSEIGGQ